MIRYRSHEHQHPFTRTDGPVPEPGELHHSHPSGDKLHHHPGTDEGDVHLGAGGGTSDRPTAFVRLKNTDPTIETLIPTTGAYPSGGYLVVDVAKGCCHRHAGRQLFIPLGAVAWVDYDLEETTLGDETDIEL